MTKICSLTFILTLIVSDKKKVFFFLFTTLIANSVCCVEFSSTLTSFVVLFSSSVFSVADVLYSIDDGSAESSLAVNGAQNLWLSQF